MNLSLSDEEAAELRQLLDASLSDMSSEIADTDNARFRAQLKDRREILRSARVKLDGDSS